ncbi:hypothetical protein BHM03_00030520 [Ensete ventricosum]|nr:hypothetical protein BHM03_00030520 [Ensete ventricosum]
MIMNLKDGSRYIINRNEDLTAIDFDDDVSLAEKEAVVLSTAVKILTTVDFDDNDSLVEKEQMILLEQWSGEVIGTEAIVAGGTTERGSSCCCNNKGCSEGNEQRSNRGGRGALGREGQRLPHRLKAATDEKPTVKKGRGLAIEGMTGRRQQPTVKDGRGGRLLRQGRQRQVVCGRSRCGSDDSDGWPPLGCGRGGYVGSSGDRGDNKMGATGSNAQRRWLQRWRWLWV